MPVFPSTAAEATTCENGASWNASFPSRWPFGYLAQPDNLSVVDGTDAEPLDETDRMNYVEAPSDCQARYRLQQTSIFSSPPFFGSSDVTGFPNPDWSTVDQMVYRTVRNRNTGDEGLAFWLLGHSLLKDYPGHKFHAFRCVTFVHFAGHFSFITPAFVISSQLPVLKKISFKLDMKQQPFFLETNSDSNQYQNSLDKCNSVNCLEVVVDPTQCNMKVLEKALTVLFKRAEECLERVETVVFDLPVLQVCRSMCQRILNNICVMNVTKFKITQSAKENTPKTVFFSCTASPRKNMRSPLLRKYVYNVSLGEGVQLQFMDHRIFGEALNDISRFFPGVEEDIYLNAFTLDFARNQLQEGKLKETWMWHPQYGQGSCQPNYGAKVSNVSAPVYADPTNDAFVDEVLKMVELSQRNTTRLPHE